MNVVLTIDGRKAIPLRALPYITNFAWSTAPDGIVHALSKPHELMVMGTQIRSKYALHAFRLEGVRYFPIQPAEWRGEDGSGHLAVAMDSLAKKCMADERIEGENHDKWRRAAVLELPPGVFVWLEDFQAWFTSTRPLVADGPVRDDDEEIDPQEIEYHQASDDLYFTPNVPDELASAIRAGFEVQFDAPVTFEPLTNILEDWFDKPLAALPQWQRWRVRTDLWGFQWDQSNEDERRAKALEWDRIHGAESETEESQRAFLAGFASGGVDLRQYAQAEALSSLAFICVVYGVEPVRWSDQSARRMIPANTVKAISSALSQAQADIDSGILPPKNSPRDWLKWGRRRALHKELPDVLKGLYVSRLPWENFEELVERVEASWPQDVHLSAVDDIATTAEQNEASEKSRGDAPSHACAPFREMTALNPGEVTIEFVAGDAGRPLLSISARGQTRRVGLVEIGLEDRRKGVTNKLGILLLGMAQGRNVDSATGARVQQISRLRRRLQLHLGLVANPFLTHKGQGRYEPKFRVIDSLGAADERAKKAAQARTVSIDGEEIQGLLAKRQIEDGDSAHTFEKDELGEDEAAQWLRENDHD